jgi:hypothetical protein
MYLVGIGSAIVILVPWGQPGSCTQTTGKFDFIGEEQETRVWPPEGVRLDYLQILPYTPPRFPLLVLHASAQRPPGRM